MESLKYLIGLHNLPGMSQKHLKLIIDYFQDSACAWNQDKYWGNIPGFNESKVAEIIACKKNTDVELVYEIFLKADVKISRLNDKDYPQLLKNTYDPPYIIYYKGNLPSDIDLCIGMVGARKASAYGRQAAESIAQGLAKRNVWVVSGMARGIDTFSHRGCLNNKGKTLAVLGSGIDVIYPRENRELYTQIISCGAVISEFPIGTQPLPYNFPARNRIISGISRGVVVVEAAEKSGSLITVDFALEQGRDVFAVPGPVSSPLSRGTHKLIKQGAKLVETAEDVLEEYLDIKQDQNKEYDLFSFTHQERHVLELLVGQQVHFDFLVKHSGLDVSQLSSLLTIWEIKGFVKQLPGKHYIIGNIGLK